MNKFISRVKNDVIGATALEYGLIAACIAVAILVSVTYLGARLTNTFNQVADAI